MRGIVSHFIRFDGDVIDGLGSDSGSAPGQVARLAEQREAKMHAANYREGNIYETKQACDTFLSNYGVFGLFCSHTRSAMAGFHSF